jgi:hypothetical protein
MRPVYVVLVLIAASCGWTPANAEDWVIGAGGASCGEWLKVRADAASDPDEPLVEGSYVSWVQGFLVGISFGEKEHHSIDPASLRAWLDNHCRAHPLDDLLRSAMDLDLDLLRHARGLPEKG